MNYAAVSIAIKRFAQRGATNKKVQAMQSALTKLLNVDSAEKPPRWGVLPV